MSGGKTVFGNTSLSSFDVIVIGSGAGGAPVADVLTRFGKKVLVIEAGHNRSLVEAAFPDLALTWLTTRTSEDKVFLVRREELPV